ncbi:MAG TPA: hypothetical protein VFD80_00960 [Flavobacteriaceae bacterium]|nr:hypothetical protein [Flavobacteriaceae bacterium]
MKKQLNSFTKENFKVPSQYFDTVEESVFLQIKVENQLQKEETFKLPEGYFNTVAEEIVYKSNDKIKRLDSSSIKVRHLRIIATIAALLILFFTVFTLNTNSSLVNFQSIEQEYLTYYIENNYLDISDLDLEMLIEVKDFDFSAVEFNEDELEDYISDNYENIDVLIDN